MRAAPGFVVSLGPSERAEARELACKCLALTGLCRLRHLMRGEAAPQGGALAPDVILAAGTSTVERFRGAWGCVLSAAERQLHGLQN
jgi:hypothetical protein